MQVLKAIGVFIRGEGREAVMGENGASNQLNPPANHRRVPVSRVKSPRGPIRPS
jgi:hypothetical protein